MAHGRWSRGPCPHTGNATVGRLTRGRTARPAAWLVAAILAAAVPAGCSRAQPPGAPSAQAGAALRIQQLDVGQGDAALLTTPEGRYILIDAGPSPDAVADMLARAGVDTLALVIASHNHSDHIGGMAEVMRRFVVRAYVDNGLPHTTATYARTLAAVEREPGLQYLAATARTITVGSITVRILPPPRLDHSQNNNSVGTLVEYGRFSALFTGDSELAELRSWLRTARVPRVTMLKVAHHGSTNGTAPDWVRATAPAIAVFSVSSRNAYGHPSPGVELVWTAIGASVYRTDRSGTIDVAATPDGRFSISEASPTGQRVR